MFTPKRLLTLVILVATAFGPIAHQAQAGLTLLSTFPSSPSNTQTGQAGAFYGQEFQAGGAYLSNLSVRIQLDPSSLPTSLGQLHLELETSNANGSIGSAIFTNFTVAAVPGIPGEVLFTPLAGYTLTAQANYWLVLSNVNASGANEGIGWDYSNSSINYTSTYSYGIPAFSSSWYYNGSSNEDNGKALLGSNGMPSTNYSNLANGPQIFDLELSAAVVPEPKSMFLLAAGMAITVVTLPIKRHQRSRCTPTSISRRNDEDR